MAALLRVSLRTSFRQSVAVRDLHLCLSAWRLCTFLGVNQSRSCLKEAFGGERELHTSLPFCAKSTVKWTPFRANKEDIVEVEKPKYYDGRHFSGPIPKDKIEESFARSGGPGGQHVNKLMSKAELSFHVMSAEWLPKWIRFRLLDIAKNKISKDGVLRVKCDEQRSQSQNLSYAYKKLAALIKQANELPEGTSEEKQILVQRYKHRQDMHRLAEKKFKTMNKQNRMI